MLDHLYFDLGVDVFVKPMVTLCAPALRELIQLRLVGCLLLIRNLCDGPELLGSSKNVLFDVATSENAKDTRINGVECSKQGIFIVGDGQHRDLNRQAQSV